MLSSLLLLGLRSLFVSASPDDEDDGIVEDEMPRPGAIPFPDGKMPSAEELLKMLDSMGGLSDEDKETLRRDLLKKAQGAVSGEEDEFGGGFVQHIATSFFASQFFILMAMLAIISLIFGRLNLPEEALDKLSVMVEKYKSLNEMGKNEFVSLMGDNLKDRIGKYVATIREESLVNRLIFHSRLPFFIAVVFLIFVFVFFGYKLYKSLTDRERKREEKRKNKQLKKKK